MKYFITYIICLTLTACGATREDHTQHQTDTVETVVTTVDHLAAQPDSTLALTGRDTTTTTRKTQEVGQAESQGSTTLVLPPIVPLVITAMKASADATPWGALALGIVTAATGAYAAHQSAQSTERGKRSDEHKADADDAWSRLVPKTDKEA